MFSTIWNKIKEMLKTMIGPKTVESTLQITPIISSKMSEAIELWSDMYEDKAPWLKEPDANDPTMIVSLGLPALIASEKARMAVLELKSEITTPTETEEVENPQYTPPVTDEFGNVVVSGQPKTIINETPKGPVERAEFMQKQYKEKLLTKIRTQLEFGIAKGSLIIKPYVVKSKVTDVNGMEDTEDTAGSYSIEFDFIQADGFYPLSFDGSGRLTEAAFVQTKVDKSTVYTRLEHHKLDGNTVTILNRAFKSTNTNDQQTAINGEADLGQEIRLTDVPEWKDLPPKAVIKNVDRLLFGYFKMPEANTIDPHSPLGVSGYSRAKTLIREADKQYSRLLWEYEGGELAIDIDRDAMNFVEDHNGNKHEVMGRMQQRLYRKIDLGESNTYQPYSPTLRDQSFINGLNNILMRIEDVCALSRGTLAEVAAEARTATELKILKQRSYAANAEIQNALEMALRDAIYVMDVYCTLYNIVGDANKNAVGMIDPNGIGQYDVSFEWDDSILVDVETELGKRMTLMQNGLASKVETRMWYFGETERQAREALDKISQESQSAMEDNIMAQMMLGGNGSGFGNKPNPTSNKVKNPSDKGGKVNAKSEQS